MKRRRYDPDQRPRIAPQTQPYRTRADHLAKLRRRLRRIERRVALYTGVEAIPAYLQDGELLRRDIAIVEEQIERDAGRDQSADLQNTAILLTYTQRDIWTQEIDDALLELSAALSLTLRRMSQPEQQTPPWMARVIAAQDELPSLTERADALKGQPMVAVGELRQVIQAIDRHAEAIHPVELRAIHVRNLEIIREQLAFHETTTMTDDILRSLQHDINGTERQITYWKQAPSNEHTEQMLRIYEQNNRWLQEVLDHKRPYASIKHLHTVNQLQAAIEQLDRELEGMSHQT